MKAQYEMWLFKAVIVLALAVAIFLLTGCEIDLVDAATLGF